MTSLPQLFLILLYYKNRILSEQGDSDEGKGCRFGLGYRWRKFIT